MAVNAYEIHDYGDQLLPIIFHENGSGCSPNWHQNPELLYCLEGEGLLVCAGEEHTMRPGHLYVVNANEMHSAFDLGGLKYHCLIVDTDFMTQNALPGVSVELQTDIQCAYAGEMMNEIYLHMQEKSAYAAAIVRGLCLLFLARLYDDFGKDAEEDRKYQGADLAIKQAVDYIRENYWKKLTLDQLAAEAGFSKYYFARQFKKATGMSVVAHINLVRCQKAQKLLAKNQLSVMQVANSCGFESASYFSKTFHSVMGVYPSQIGK